MLIGLFFLVVGWLVYSYTQIDLNLTLLRTPWFLKFQTEAIQIGYFNRPLSTAIFIVLLVVLAFFSWRFYLKEENSFSRRKKILLLLLISLFTVFSYPAFSHDIFNYIFDARIMAFHHADPYTTTALMFPGDDWTRFMNWTHRTYPYGPVFLPISLLFYVLGFGKFIFTLMSFKAGMLLSLFGSSWLIYQQAKWRGVMFFLLNPIIFLEVIISGHLDIIMLFFALLAVHLVFNKKTFSSLFAIVASVGIKFSTVLLIPALYLPKLSINKRIYLLVILGYLGAIFQVIFREFLPHYLIVPIGLSALLFSKKNNLLFFSTLFISLIILCLRYLPFIYTGTWFTIALPTLW